ncbi:MAG: hypothetical protein NTV02_02160 [Candidatus Zambryskibacteria bacterium]|nr:hypothetical protein [Candidatus Zambryskibacteria bacterium]
MSDQIQGGSNEDLYRGGDPEDSVVPILGKQGGGAGDIKAVLPDKTAFSLACIVIHSFLKKI